MTMRHAIRLVPVVIVFVTAGILWSAVSGTRGVKRLDRSIEVQEATVDSLRAERRKIDERRKEIQKEVDELPRGAKMGHSIRSSLQLNKAQEIVEGGIQRARIRIDNLQARKQAARQRTMRRVVWMGIGGGLLGGVYWLGRRRVS
jgi:cell division protein FtsB